MYLFFVTLCESSFPILCAMSGAISGMSSSAFWPIVITDSRTSSLGSSFLDGTPSILKYKRCLYCPISSLVSVFFLSFLELSG